MSNQGLVIHLDSDENILKNSQHLFNQLDLNLSLEVCQSKEAFDQILGSESNKKRVRCLIFDLLGDKPRKEEFEGDDAEFLDYIIHNFQTLNVPIFIYSGSIELISEKFQNCGTVYKVDKDKGIDYIFDRIKLFEESGFLDVFSPGGIVEEQMRLDLHKSFVGQFKNDEDLEKIISSIKENCEEQKLVKRVERIFTRIAMRSLLTELLSPEVDEKGNIVEEFVGSTEHYVHRINNQIGIWTGDIFKKKEAEEFLIILTPRCNVIRTKELLACPFMLGDIITKRDKVGKAAQGDPTVSGYERYLPPSPIFKGGKIILSKFFMINKEEFQLEYERFISLSDELTNEILGKFGSYFFRTGITPWDSGEICGQISK